MDIYINVYTYIIIYYKRMVPSVSHEILQFTIMFYETLNLPSLHLTTSSPLQNRPKWPQNHRTLGVSGAIAVSFRGD